MNIAATYDYTDAEGKVVFQVVRLAPKGFRQRQPDLNGKDGWVWNLRGVKRVLYRLPEVIKAVAEERTIYITEKQSGNDFPGFPGFSVWRSGGLSCRLLIR